MMMATVRVAIALCAALGLQGVSASNSTKLPHIIIFLVDDLGWYDVGFHNRDLHTPTMNQLRREGVELEWHYTFPQCSPSRSSLMSGRLPINVNEVNPAEITSIGGVDIRMTMLPKKLKQAGYKTAMVGKWHLGARQEANLPRKRGFDQFFGFLGGGEDHFTQRTLEAKDSHGEHAIDLWRNDKPAYTEDNRSYSCELYAEEAVKIIHDHDRSVPLFFYISMQSTHAPYQCPESYMDKRIKYDDRRIMRGMISCVDQATYNVTEALKKRHMWDNTFLLWSSDNGGPQYKSGNNYPLRGGKGTDFEGGIRIPSFIAGGAVKLRPGSSVKAMIHFADWYATFCAMAGVDPTDDVGGVPPIDSIDQSEVLTKSWAKPARTEVIISSNAIIVGDLKYVTSTRTVDGECPGGCGYWTTPEWPKDDARTPHTKDPGCAHIGCLFNLAVDPEERNNIVFSHPQAVEEMRDKLEHAKAKRFQTMFVDPTAKSCQSLTSFMKDHKGFAGPVCSSSKTKIVDVRRLRGLETEA